MRALAFCGAALGALAVLSLGACGKQTGIVLEVSAPEMPTSVAQGLSELRFVAAHRSWCERWVADAGVSPATRADVRTRDLAKDPYELWITPTHFTDISEPVELIALGYDASGTLIARGDFGPHPFELHAVNRYSAELRYLAAADALGQASYVAADGCVCLPGLPWIGTGSGSGCDLDVVTSFDRLVDTATCELAAGKRELAGPVCDGQRYGDEGERDLPCFAPDQGTGCAVITRHCYDADGIAYQRSCRFDDAAPTLPSQALCAAYRTCEQTPCSDLIGCFLAAVPASEQLSCTLRAQAGGMGEPPQPCADGVWQAALDFAQPPRTDAACVSSVIEGVSQPPFQLGLLAAGQDTAQVVSPDCPPTLRVDAIDVPELDALPAEHELDLTIGDARVHVTIHVVRGCTDGPSLVCTRS